jgi:hypothetical protein
MIEMRCDPTIIARNRVKLLVQRACSQNAFTLVASPSRFCHWRVVMVDCFFMAKKPCRLVRYSPNADVAWHGWGGGGGGPLQGVVVVLQPKLQPRSWLLMLLVQPGGVLAPGA